MKRIGLITLLSALGAAPLAPAAAQDLLWTRQIGTAETDVGNGVAVDGAGNAYITGWTWGSLGGRHAGVRDVFLAKYDAAGTLLWTRQTGTAEDEWSSGVAADGAGNAYISGSTLGSLGGTNAGGWDAFLAKYDAAGALLWTRQIGTTGFDEAWGVALDGASNAYITGRTGRSLGGPSARGWDAFLAKYDAAGALLWTRQTGTAEFDSSIGVALDSAGNAYITGYTEGDLGGPNAGREDIFLAKYDASGSLLWTRQTGTAGQDIATDVAVDGAGNAYTTGYTYGSLGGPSAGLSDAFLAKYNAAGALLWTRQTGTTAIDYCWGVAVDGAGNAYITGVTYGSLGATNAGRGDYFLAKFGASGTLLWTLQTGTAEYDWCTEVAVDGAGNAYITGYTGGSLGGPNAGGRDAILAKYGEAPCYADCDQSTGVGVLDMLDFLCFQAAFVNGEEFACDCDTSTGNGVCDIFDFLCFENAFVAGCP